MGEQKIAISGDYITLSQLLKKLDFISSGGEARFFLQEYAVAVNDVPEARRGRKLYRGDQVRIDGQSFLLS